MAARPAQDALEQEVRGLAVRAETVGEHLRLVGREVMQFDAAPDIERRHPLVADEIGRGGDAEQAEGQPEELLVLRAAIVALADAGEKFIRTELLQAADVVDFIDENDERLAPAVVEIDLADRAHEALERRFAQMRVPVRFEFVFEMHLLAHAGQHAEVPLLDVEILPDAGEIEHDHRQALGAELRGRPHHERTLAHLPRGQHVAEIPGAQGFEHPGIGGAGDVGLRILPQRAAGHEERRFVHGSKWRRRYVS